VRKGEKLQVPVKLTPAPRKPDPQETWLDGKHPLKGAQVANLSPSLGEELSISGWKGVAVIAVKRGSFARELGLRPGDLIARINDQDIDSVDGLQAALSQPHDEWKISIMRDGKLQSTIVK